MTKFKKGDHMQLVGDYRGLAFNGHTWVRFDCSGCALASGLSLPGQRLSINDHVRVWNKYFINAPRETIVRHDKDLHSAWLRADKPLPFTFKQEKLFNG